MKNKKIFVLGIIILMIIFGFIFLLYINDNKQNYQPVTNENKIKVENYIKENISNLSPKKEVLGGKFFVTNLNFIDDNQVEVEYEDGHVFYKANISYEFQNGELVINDFVIDETPSYDQGKVQAIDCKDEQRNADFCIEIYQPVCGQVQVECIKAPCPPIRQTFANSCKACANERVISYIEGACRDNDDIK